MFNASRGFVFLSVSQWFLHWNVSHENLLVFLLDEVLVNEKLTDSRSSRNNNTLMPDMTFTEGIGNSRLHGPGCAG